MDAEARPILATNPASGFREGLPKTIALLISGNLGRFSRQVRKNIYKLPLLEQITEFQLPILFGPDALSRKLSTCATCHAGACLNEDSVQTGKVVWSGGGGIRHIVTVYSWRSAASGSSSVARRAGMRQASRPVRLTMRIEPAKVHGSVDLTCHS
jgi:hypothetical protein